MNQLEKLEYDRADKKRPGERRRGVILPDGIYKPTEVADAIGRSGAHVYALMNRGVLDYLTLGAGGPRRIRGASVLKLAVSPQEK